MIKNAFEYEEQIRSLMLETWYDEKYMYYHCEPYHDYYHNIIADGDWNERRFVSVRKNRIIGFISYSIDRTANFAHSLGIIKFKNADTVADTVEFSRDVIQTVSDIFYKFRMNKLKFTVIKGNPIEKAYDKFIEDFQGNICGTLWQDVRLLDGRMYDRKIYEISRQRFITAHENIKRKYGIKEQGQ